MSRKPWTSNEIAHLRRIYADTPRKDLEWMFNRKWKAIHSKAWELGLKRRPVGNWAEKAAKHVPLTNYVWRVGL